MRSQIARGRRRTARIGMTGALCSPLLFASVPSPAGTVTIPTPGGDVTISVPHAGPSGSLVAAPETEATPFRPPSIFSAPLPSGSGARALGLAGAFTAVADDATAASWNPAGLMQLERPEASAVFRFSAERNTHTSSDADFQVGEDAFESFNVNYLSLVYPFRMKAVQRNAVVSFNYQEAYDFTQEFTADLSRQSGSRSREQSEETHTGAQTEYFNDGVVEIDILIRKTTTLESSLEYLLASDTLAGLTFEQEGMLYALTPSFAAEITPKLWVGGSFNYYRDGGSFGRPIRSETEARYSGTSSSRTMGETVRTTDGTYTYSGWLYPPSLPGVKLRIPETSGSFAPFSDEEGVNQGADIHVDGVYTEVNEFSGLDGFNGTLGVLYTVSRHLSLGGSVDLPWTAKGRQEKTTRNQITTYDASRTRVLAEEEMVQTRSSDVAFEFPLYWALGAVWRWTPDVYSTLDLSRTHWSDFSFQADEAGAINPFDGRPLSESQVDDTWAVRTGFEYLVVRPQTMIPLRAGFAWEERPALDRPDDFFSVSVGSGLSLGKEPGLIIFDVAYVFTWANDVRSIVPEQPGLMSDITEHQVFFSCIKHF